MDPKTSRDLPTEPPKHDAERDMRKAAIKDAEKTDQSDRDTVHGDGKDIGVDI